MKLNNISLLLKCKSLVDIIKDLQKEYIGQLYSSETLSQIKEKIKLEVKNYCLFYNLSDEVYNDLIELISILYKVEGKM